jgi:hypothetical protein
MEMDDFLKQYRIKCEAKVLQYGFKRKKNVFARLVNDVLQSFYVEKLSISPYERACRVGFSVLPICQKLEIEPILGVYYLRKFEISHCVESDRWRYKSIPENIGVCVDEILMYINKYLLPFFERANSCKTALPEVIELEKLFNANRLESLKLSNIADNAEPNAELNLSDNAKYFMALKSGNYDFALKSRKALLKQSIAAYQSVQNNKYMTKEKLHEKEEILSKLQVEILHLEEEDWDYFNTIIANNEAYSIERLKDII